MIIESRKLQKEIIPLFVRLLDAKFLFFLFLTTSFNFYFIQFNSLFLRVIFFLQFKPKKREKKIKFYLHFQIYLVVMTFIPRDEMKSMNLMKKYKFINQISENLRKKKFNWKALTLKT